MSSHNLSGVRLPAHDLALMIEGGLMNYEGRDYLEAFLGDNRDQIILIVPKVQIDQIIEEHRQAYEILEQERQLLESYGYTFSREKGA